MAASRFAIFFILLATLAVIAPGAAAAMATAGHNHPSRPGSLVKGFHEHSAGAAPALAQST